MLWIGLTGSIGTGKSSVAKILREFGMPVIDADELSRQVVRPGERGHQAILQIFGPKYFSPDGELDRKKLGQLIFEKEEARNQLEQALHPLIQLKKQEEKKRLEEQDCPVAFYEVPLLFEKGLEDQFDKIVVVYAPVEEQRRRLKGRDLFSEKEIETRIGSQIPIDEKVKRSDFVIMNTGSERDLKANVLSVLGEFIK